MNATDKLEQELADARQTIAELRDQVHGLEVEIEDLEHQLAGPCDCAENDLAADQLETLETAIADLQRGVVSIYELYHLVGLR